MKTGICTLGIALVMFAGNAIAKDATPNEIRKSTVDPAKKERRFAAPSNGANQTDDWQPYLRWHRDAVSLQGQAERFDPLARDRVYTQL